jgi:hypothetical protein
MADSEDRGETVDTRKPISDYIADDKISFVMYLLRIYTLYAGFMAMFNPYR